MDIFKEAKEELKSEKIEVYNKTAFQQYEQMTDLLFEKMREKLRLELKLNGMNSTGDEVEQKFQEILYPLIDSKLSYFILIYVLNEIFKMKNEEVDLNKVVDKNLIESIVNHLELDNG